MIGTNDELKEVSPAQKQDQVVIESLRQFMDVEKFKQSKNGAALLDILLNQNSKKDTRSILTKLKTMFMCQVPVARLCSLQFIRESMEASNRHVVELVAELFLEEFSKIVSYRPHVKSILRGSTYFLPKIGRYDSQDDTNRIIKISNTFFRMASECIYIWGKMYFIDSPFSAALKQLESTCKLPLFPSQFKFFTQTKITAFLARGLKFNFGDRKQYSKQIQKLNESSNGKAMTVPVEKMGKTEESEVYNEKNEQGKILGQHQSDKGGQRNVLAQANRSCTMETAKKYKRKERISQVRPSSVSSYSFETPELIGTQNIREARSFSLWKQSRIEIPLGVIAQQQDESNTAPTSLNQPKPQTDLVQPTQSQQLTQQAGILPTQTSTFVNVQINATQDSSTQNIDKGEQDQIEVQPVAKIATNKPISILGSSESKLVEEECLIPELSDRDVSPKNSRKEEQATDMETEELRRKTRTMRRSKKEQKGIGQQKIRKNQKAMKEKIEPEDDKGKLTEGIKRQIRQVLPIESPLQKEQKPNLAVIVKDEKCSTKVTAKDIIQQESGRIFNEAVLSGGVLTRAPRVQLKSGLQMSIAFQPSVNQEVSRHIEAKIHEQFASFKSQIIAHQEELFLKTTRVSKAAEDTCNSCATQTHSIQRRRASQINVKAKPQIMQQQSSVAPRRLSVEYASVERRRQGEQPPANTLLYLLYRRKSMGVI